MVNDSKGCEWERHRATASSETDELQINLTHQYKHRWMAWFLTGRHRQNEKYFKRSPEKYQISCSLLNSFTSCHFPGAGTLWHSFPWIVHAVCLCMYNIQSIYNICLRKKDSYQNRFMSIGMTTESCCSVYFKPIKSCSTLCHTALMKTMNHSWKPWISCWRELRDHINMA